MFSIRGDDILCMIFLELPSNMADSFIDGIRVAFWFINMLTISQTQWVPSNENLDSNLDSIIRCLFLVLYQVLNPLIKISRYSIFLKHLMIYRIQSAYLRYIFLYNSTIVQRT